MTLSVSEMAERFTGTYLNTNPDPHFRDLFAPTVIAWHNFDAKKGEYTADAIASFFIEKRAQMRELLPDFRADDFIMHESPTALVYTQTTRGTLPDGTEVAFPGVVVMEIENGKIVTINSVGDKQQRDAMEAEIARNFPHLKEALEREPDKH